jgi:hypothetical protein
VDVDKLVEDNIEVANCKYMLLIGSAGDVAIWSAVSERESVMERDRTDNPTLPE